MLKRISAVLIAIFMALSVMSIISAPAQAAGGYWDSSARCSGGHRNINVRVCTVVRWYHDNSWRPTTVKVMEVKIYPVGDIPTLEGKRSVLIDDPALVASNNRVVKRYADFHFNANSRARVYRPRVLINKRGSMFGYEFTLRNNGGPDSEGVLITPVAKNWGR